MDIQRNASAIHMLRSLRAANDTVMELAARGFTVLRVDVNGARPVIEVAYSRRCESLCGAAYIYRNVATGNERVMTAAVKHCRVVWTVRGN